MTAAVELKMPLGYVEMDTEEMEYLEGGGTISLRLGVSCTVGGLVSGMMTGLIAGAVTAITGGLGGFLGWTIGQFISDLIASSLNRCLPNNGGWYSKTITLSKTAWWLPNWSGTYYFDIGSLLGQGGGRFASGAAARVLLNGRQVATAFA